MRAGRVKVVGSTLRAHSLSPWGKAARAAHTRFGRDAERPGGDPGPAPGAPPVQVVASLSQSRFTTGATLVTGIYRDRLRKVDGAWKFVERNVSIDSAD